MERRAVGPEEDWPQTAVAFLDGFSSCRRPPQFAEEDDDSPSRNRQTKGERMMRRRPLELTTNCRSPLEGGDLARIRMKAAKAHESKG